MGTRWGLGPATTASPGGPGAHPTPPALRAAPPSIRSDQQSDQPPSADVRQIPPYPTQALLERVRQWAAPDGRRPEEFAVVFGTEIRGSQARRGCISSLWEFRNATASILTPTSIPPIPSQTQHRTPPLMPKPSSLNQPSPHAVLPKPIPHVPSSPSHPTQTVPLQPHPLQPQPPYTTLPAPSLSSPDLPTPPSLP